MTYTILEHTADVRLLVEGGTLAELFAEGLRGMMEVLKPEGKGGTAETQRRIHLESASRTALLVDFLNEALCLAQTHRESYAAVTFQSISETRLDAALRGREVKSFGEDVKAVTYHEAQIRETAKGTLETMLVLDI
ncbi:MAG TPA: archease [Candidatus Acidoferrales bacterium]|nr:archease [Candidatus Acidoferrales bacterium]